jgi:hypothetical protein
MAMTGTYAEHPIVICLDSFGDMTVGTDGNLLSQPQNIRLFGTEVLLRKREPLQTR